MSAISLPKLPAIASSAIAMEVLNGLTERPKTLSPWLFYDRGGIAAVRSNHRTAGVLCYPDGETILATHAAEIVAAAAGGRDLSIIELGAGTATKTGLLLDAAVASGNRDLLPHRCVGDGAGGSADPAGSGDAGGDRGTHRRRLHRRHAAEQCSWIDAPEDGWSCTSDRALEIFRPRMRSRCCAVCAPSCRREIACCWAPTW